MVPKLRPRVDCLSEPQQALLARALQTLMDSRDPAANYEYWAGIHRHCCPHHSELFLPWHRAYIREFERALQNAVADSSLMLPYWDWTITPSVPALFEKPPFYVPREPGRNGEIPTAAQIVYALQTPRFDVFGGSGCGFPSSGGCLESHHAKVHLWVGKQMADAKTAAYDPIFWFHHSFVDSLWLAWQRTHTGQPRCLSTPLQGIPGGWTVNDTLDVGASRLDYDYAVCRVEIDVLDWRTDGPSRERHFDLPPGADIIRVILEDVQITRDGDMPTFLDFVSAEPGLHDSIPLFGLHHHSGHATSGACQHQTGSASGCFSVRREEARVTRRVPFTLRFRWGTDAVSRAELQVGRVVLIVYQNERSA